MCVETKIGVGGWEDEESLKKFEEVGEKEV